ncbi:hypothetical protein ACG873_00700 (plasmid) [Mesorhizobium sp. AaZ16]|uniref:hypothetical protein n=1 Tax=Mesorhizobium sp. AaZ16 TaxID=3402289 RepID=UPI00374E9BB9
MSRLNEQAGKNGGDVVLNDQPLFVCDPQCLSAFFDYLVSHQAFLTWVWQAVSGAGEMFMHNRKVGLPFGVKPDHF